MSSRRRKIAWGAAGFLLLFIAVTVVSFEASSEAPTKYEKCRLKCLKHYDRCSDDAQETGDRERRIEKKTECELRKRNCTAKCDD